MILKTPASNWLSSTPFKYVPEKQSMESEAESFLKVIFLCAFLRVFGIHRWLQGKTTTSTFKLLAAQRG